MSKLENWNLEDPQKIDQAEKDLSLSIDRLSSKLTAGQHTQAHESALTLKSICNLIDAKAETNRIASDALHAARQHCKALSFLLKHDDASHPVAAPQMINSALAELDVACKQRKLRQTRIDPIAITAIKIVTEVLNKLRVSL